MKTPAQHMREWGPLGVSLLAVVACVVLGVIIYTRPVSVIPATNDHTFTAAVGTEGFKVADFCADPQTQVKANPLPDAGTGYQLTRGRDAKLETVTIVQGPDGETKIATHYFYVTQADGSVVQQSEPAFANADAWTCIHQKAG